MSKINRYVIQNKCGSFLCWITCEGEAIWTDDIKGAEALTLGSARKFLKTIDKYQKAKIKKLKAI